jgi:hypothetical protein
MKLKKRKITLSIIIIILIFAILRYLYGCISPSLKMQVLDENGTPIVGAYVVYGYTGIESKIVDWDYYRRPGTIAQTDMDGNFSISPSIHMRTPFFQYKLYPEIYAIYDPKTHCVGILPSKIWLDRQDVSKEFKKHYWWFDTKKVDGIDVLIFNDVTDDPAKWSGSIRQLIKAFKYGDVVGHWNGWEAPFEQRKQLYNCLTHEYRTFINKYGNESCGSLSPKNSGLKTFRDLVANDLRSLANYEKKVLEQKN